MNQIDWPWLAMTLLWTGGLGAGLSILGYAYDRAVREGTTLWIILTRPGCRLALLLGSGSLLAGILFSQASLGLKVLSGVAIAWLALELALKKQK
jgi:hypothetical protein